MGAPWSYLFSGYPFVAQGPPGQLTAGYVSEQRGPPRAWVARREIQGTSTVQILSGSWMLATDSQNVGQAEGWFAGVAPEAQPAPVPGIIQQVFPSYHGVAWY